jgi:hypothetical protein
LSISLQALILASMALVRVGFAAAAPRVALLPPAVASPSEVAVARATLEAEQLEVRLLDRAALPLTGETADLSGARTEVSRALEVARARFVATRFEEARAAIAAAEMRASRWAGHPAVARGLAELALVGAECGDAKGFATAAARAQIADLDPGRWSPAVRDAYKRALAERDRLPRARLSVGGTGGATVFIDGAPRGQLPLETTVSVGDHAVYVNAEGSSPYGRALHIAGDTKIAVALTALAEDERLAALRQRAEDGEPPSTDELAFLARRLDVEAVVVLQFRGRQVVATLGGPGLRERPSEAAGERAAAIGEVLHPVGLGMRRQCVLSHAAPAGGRAGTALELRIGANACVSQVRLSYRVRPGIAWKTAATVPRAGEARMVVDAGELPSSARPYAFEYFLSGEAARGAIVATLSDATAPLRIPIEPNRSRWYRKWWVWTLAGVVTGGVVVTAAVLATRPAPDARVVGPP